MDRFLCIFEVASASIKSDELHAVQGHSLSATALGYVRFKKQTFSIFGMGFLHARWPSCGSTNSNKERKGEHMTAIFPTKNSKPIINNSMNTFMYARISSI